MNEIVPGIFHWSAHHQPIGGRVSSHYLRDAGVVLDPKVPEEGWEALPGVTAIHIDKLCPDEGAFHIAAAKGTIAFADGVNHYGQALAFFPDDLLGEHPDRVKEGLKQSFPGLLERDFDTLLFAHGEPIARGGHHALREFATSRVGHEDFGQAL